MPPEVAPGGLAPVTLRVPIRVRPAGTDALYRPYHRDGDPGTVATTVPAIPYFLWANRATGPMRVWIPVADR